MKNIPKEVLRGVIRYIVGKEAEFSPVPILTFCGNSSTGDIWPFAQR